MTLARAVVLAMVVIVAVLVGYGALQSVPPGHGGFALVDSLPGPDAELWAVGDGDAGPNGRAVARMIIAAQPDRLLYLGDVYENGTAVEFRANYAGSFGRMARITAPTPGNHDWPNHAKGYDPYWSSALGRARTSHWYAFDAGGWQILSLNSQADHDRNSPQLHWLRSRLLTPGTCTLAFWHRPRYSAGRHGDQEDVQPFWEALRGHASIVVNGHDHDMQRIYPVDGITEFVAGAGGRGRYGIDRRDQRVAFGNDQSYGALRLRLSRGVAFYAFVTVTGRVKDAGRVRCDPGPAVSSSTARSAG